MVALKRAPPKEKDLYIQKKALACQGFSIAKNSKLIPVLVIAVGVVVVSIITGTERIKALRF